MLAIYGDAPLALNQKRQINLYPCHDLVMGAYCTSLPALLPSRPDVTSSHATLPAVLLCLPSPETFAMLHSYLYTQQPTYLVAALAPPSEADLLHFAAHAAKVHGLWRNACVRTRCN
jgi:hypothetical protein